MAYSYSESRFAYLAIIVSELSFCIIFTSDLQFFFKLLRLKNNNKKTVEKLTENIKSVRFPQASYPSQIFVYWLFLIHHVRKDSAILRSARMWWCYCFYQHEQALLVHIDPIQSHIDCIPVCVILIIWISWGTYRGQIF